MKSLILLFLVGNQNHAMVLVFVGTNNNEIGNLCCKGKQIIFCHQKENEGIRVIK